MIVPNLHKLAKVNCFCFCGINFYKHDLEIVQVIRRDTVSENLKSRGAGGTNELI